uniref:Stomatal closure-related actin-binding protein 2-like n=1 Tax=Rhizophora mucronata TaxID=61149 RepID=A0A2P2JDM1_RHIMU
MSKRAEENRSSLYLLDGTETLGSCLQLHPRSDSAPLLSKCSIQWHRLSSDGSQKEVISGILSITAPRLG